MESIDYPRVLRQIENKVIRLGDWSDDQELRVAVNTLIKEISDWRMHLQIQETKHSLTRYGKLS